MTTLAEAWAAGVDAVIANNSLNRGGFIDAMQTVLTISSQSEVGDFVDATATEYNRLGIINNPTYASLRNEIISEGAVTAKALFDALAVTINALPSAAILIQDARLIDLRDERDNINNAIARLDVLIAAEPAGTVGRLVKDVLRNGKSLLRQQKETVRTEIQNITGDPDN